jgi:hypothetical protein
MHMTFGTFFRVAIATVSVLIFLLHLPEVYGSAPAQDA